MKNTAISPYSRRRVLPVFILFLAGAIGAYFLLTWIQGRFLAGNVYIEGFGDTIGGAIAGDPAARLRWILLDFTQTTFLASPLASVFMMIGTLIGCILEMKKSPHAGTGVCGASPVFVPVFITSILVVAAGELCWGGFHASDGGWIGTFAAFLICNVYLLWYGADDPRKILTVFVYTLVVPFFVTRFFLLHVIYPVGLPPFCAVSIGCIISGPVGDLLFRLLPWMKPAAAAAPPAEEPAEPAEAGKKAPSEAKWFFHAVFGDYGQLFVWGSSIGAVFMFAGAVIAWLLNPLNPDYSTGSFPMAVCAGIATAALSIFLYYPRWKKNGMAFTFGSLVLTLATLSFFPRHPAVVICTVIVAAVVTEPCIELSMKLFMKGKGHPLPWVHLGILVPTVIWSFILKLLLPLTGLQ